MPLQQSQQDFISTKRELMTTNFLKNIAKKAIPDFEEYILEPTGFLDTGCLALNALCNADLFGGVPNNKVTFLAGEESTGKTFFALSIVKNFLETNENANVLYIDSEFALDNQFLQKRGIDPDKILVRHIGTVEETTTNCMKILTAYENTDEADRGPLMIVLDSLGNLSTLKEMEDSEQGNDKRDMTRAQKVRAMFRTMLIKMGKLNVPMIVCNHTYEVVGSYIPKKEMSGGGGAKYASSLTLFLSKAKDKDGTDVVGNIITVKTDKSRYSREQQSIKLKLSFETGLDKYYGMLDIAEKTGVIQKVSTQYMLPDGSKVFGKHINENPEKYFTSEILNLINERCKVVFALGSGKTTSEEELEEELEQYNIEKE